MNVWQVNFLKQLSQCTYTCMLRLSCDIASIRLQQNKISGVFSANQTVLKLLNLTGFPDFSRTKLLLFPDFSRHCVLLCEQKHYKIGF